MTDSTCSAPECAKPVKVRGRCHTHYMRWYRSPEGQAAPKTMGRPVQQPNPCIAGRCDRTADARSLCLMHYRRWRRTGEPLGLTVMQQFFLHVAEDNDTGCWLWNVPRDGFYAQFTENGRNHLAHRWLYERMVAEIPDGLTIDHLCRRPSCVNPWHMEPVPLVLNIARGDSPSALNARKTGCLRGHPFDAVNTYVTPDGRRQCRSCRALRAMAH